MGKNDKWQDITIGAIEYIQKQKKEAKKEPTHVSRSEIRELTNKAIDTMLNKLVEAGEIKEVDTMHDKCYELITKK